VEKRRDVSLKVETEAGGYGGEWGNRGQRRGDGKANRSEQLRGKEGTTCFAVSLTPAIIHRERPFISCWTWRMERERTVFSWALGSFANASPLDSS
jgi:hypothetical protein